MAARGSGQCALLSADLDGLKRLNDEHGHAAGDAALVAFAAVLSRTFRREDIVARLGGDQFVVLINTTTRHTDACLGRLAENLEDENEARPRAHALSASIGVLEVIAAEERWLETLLERVDALMYEKKRARRASTGSNGHGARP